MERLIAELKKNKRVVIYIMLIALVLLIIVVFLPHWISSVFFSSNYDETKDIRSTILKTIAGFIALMALYLNYRRTSAVEEKNRIDEETRIQDSKKAKSEYEQAERRLQQEQEKVKNELEQTEKRLNLEQSKADKELLLQQYTEASKLLNSNDISSRLSGIYLFEKIMNCYQEYYLTTIEILSAYIRLKREITIKNSHYYFKNELLTIDSEFPIEIDTQAALKVLLRRNLAFENEYKNYLIDLSNIYLEKSTLRGNSFVRINFRNSLINKSIIAYSDIEESIFEGTRIENSVFDKVKTCKSKFINTCFLNSNINDWKIEDCDLSNFNFPNSTVKNVQINNLQSYFYFTKKGVVPFINGFMNALVLEEIRIDEQLISKLKERFPDIYEKFLKKNELDVPF